MGTYMSHTKSCLPLIGRTLFTDANASERYHVGSKPYLLGLIDIAGNEGKSYLCMEEWSGSDDCPKPSLMSPTIYDPPAGRYKLMVGPPTFCVVLIYKGVIALGKLAQVNILVKIAKGDGDQFLPRHCWSKWVSWTRKAEPRECDSCSVFSFSYKVNREKWTGRRIPQFSRTTKGSWAMNQGINGGTPFRER
jgi:hypothetical protein